MLTQYHCGLFDVKQGKISTTIFQQQTKTELDAILLILIAEGALKMLKIFRRLFKYLTHHVCHRLFLLKVTVSPE